MEISSYKVKRPLKVHQLGQFWKFLIISEALGQYWVTPIRPTFHLQSH